MDLQLTGKVAVVTGTASGIGRAVARLFAAEGVRVCGADINQVGAERTAAELRDAGSDSRAFALNVSDRAAWERLTATVEAEVGPIDILCNVAGPGAKTGQLDTNDAEWQRQLDGHMTGVFIGCQTVLPGMMERRAGKIVNICSFTAHGVTGNIPGYCAAFGGILAYTKSLARFAAPYNINVNCVSPGNIDTAMTRDGWLDRPGALEELQANTPIGRVGQPDDIANWVVFLASERARHAVGIEINVSGGQLLA
ncbi:MAG: 3-oxoacyl-[acyl-carrier protein] reductase [Thermomicrobiales bacterium]|nr:3-oxoacyl-[acyl-carrier protein] reductase [Thermomicrobiales bacterium]MEA2527887.1 3-oxoacyl-[acyl-carrier protein] reductase [Thermomicrobiales bacterium]MEA2582081.1 3-oxoacyl-[acyl-carrier protein] reductase [Thermomicrobiales bacterium]MEA2594732.1 3-oxoacyl-[acyl-carrier protein] reductase [Thermomicrobiales bacterium]